MNSEWMLRASWAASASARRACATSGARSSLISSTSAYRRASIRRAWPICAGRIENWLFEDITVCAREITMNYANARCSSVR